MISIATAVLLLGTFVTGMFSQYALEEDGWGAWALCVCAGGIITMTMYAVFFNVFVHFSVK
jgi:hypothetical protein